MASPCAWRKLTRGEFVDTATDLARYEQWCDSEVLRILRRRSLAALRAQVEPVDTAAFGRFLPAWQQLGSAGTSGVDGLAAVIEQLAGVALPASAVEPLVFGQRVRDYSPAMLDELLASGEVIWSGASDGWVAFHPADTAGLTLTAPAELELTDVHRAILAALDSGGAYFFRQLSVPGVSEQALKEALWQLIWSGRATGDTFAPIRAVLTGTRRSSPPHRRRRPPRLSHYSVTHAQARSTDPTVAGRWSALPAAEPDSTVRAHFQADILLARYGVLTRGSVAAEEVPGGFAMLYKVLTALEDAGRCQRGYFVESLGGAQFSTANTVDTLRSFAGGVDGAVADPTAVALAACDPANPYGAALPWPARGGDTSHRPGRKAGALVVLVGGELVWFVERGGRSMLTFSTDQGVHHAAAAALAGLVSTRRVDSLLVERIDGAPVLGDDSAAAAALAVAGFAKTPRGLRLR